jgi:hypothetical protein
VHGDGSKETYTLNPVSGKAQYTGNTTYLGSCYSSKGGVLIKNGYKYAEKLPITVTKTAGGSATAFTGQLSLVFVTTPAGKNKCPTGSETVALTSLKKTG